MKERLISDAALGTTSSRLPEKVVVSFSAVVSDVELVDFGRDVQFKIYGTTYRLPAGDIQIFG